MLKSQVVNVNNCHSLTKTSEIGIQKKVFTSKCQYTYLIVEYLIAYLLNYQLPTNGICFEGKVNLTEI